MSCIIRLYQTAGLTRWGIFHNIGTQEETGYIYIHLAGRQLSFLWNRND